jgi:ABC-type transporter Mla MlaB component
MLMLKIQRIPEKGGTRLLLSGELRYAHVEEVRVEIANAVAPVTLDLQEVGVVDIDGIRLLNECRTQGAKVKNCAPYIREWMRQERRTQKR